MIIKSMSVDYGTLEMTVKFQSAEDMRSTADQILNNGRITKAQMDAQIKAFTDRGLMIEALRYHRSVTNSSLRESKEYVEAIRDGRPV